MQPDYKNLEQEQNKEIDTSNSINGADLMEEDLQFVEEAIQEQNVEINTAHSINDGDITDEELEALAKEEAEQKKIQEEQQKELEKIQKEIDKKHEQEQKEIEAKNAKLKKEAEKIKAKQEKEALKKAKKEAKEKEKARIKAEKELAKLNKKLKEEQKKQKVKKENEPVIEENTQNVSQVFLSSVVKEEKKYDFPLPEAFNLTIEDEQYNCEFKKTSSNDPNKEMYDSLSDDLKKIKSYEEFCKDMDFKPAEGEKNCAKAIRFGDKFVVALKGDLYAYENGNPKGYDVDRIKELTSKCIKDHILKIKEEREAQDKMNKDLAEKLNKEINKEDVVDNLSNDEKDLSKNQEKKAEKEELEQQNEEVEEVPQA